MSMDDAAIVAAWAILLLMIIAVAPRVRFALRLDRPVPQPLRLDPLDFDLDGPVIDLEPA